MSERLLPSRTGATIGAKRPTAGSGTTDSGAVAPASQPKVGWVFWITGLSGSGKTTIGDLLFQRLHAVDDAVVLLDGDALRREAKEEFGYSPEERRRAAFHYSNLARTNAARGTHVVVATISMYADCRLWNRRHLPRYYEIYLRVPLDVLIGRDAGNLYSRAIAGKVSSVVGVDLPFEEPESADLIIDNHGSVAADQAADDIWERIKVLPGVLNEPG